MIVIDEYAELADTAPAAVTHAESIARRGRAVADGRVSTEDQQDPQASKAWQLSRARSLITPTGGEIVAEFFDIGLFRSLPWKRRPEALRLLEAIKSPGRDFDAVVIGEPQRAFYGSPFA